MANLVTSTGFFIADPCKILIYLLRTLLVLFESADHLLLRFDGLVMHRNVSIIIRLGMTGCG